MASLSASLPGYFACRLPDGDIDAVEEVGHGDHENDRGQSLLVIILGCLVIDLVRNRVGPVGETSDGLGKREGEYTEPNQPVDPNKQHRINAAFYGVSPSPADNSVWGSTLGYPGGMIRLDPGANPPSTALAEIYDVPAPGYSPRVMNIDSKGVTWTSLASGHLASFDRRKCKVLNGPTATGKHCPEGWTLYPYPGPQFSNVTDPGSAEASYATWVDQHDTLGLGKDVPISTGNENDGLLALVNGKFVTLRVPYPQSFYAKGMDGRIDDPNGGWKGRGIWTTAGNRTPFHVEGGKGSLPKVVHFQVRPDPLAD